MHILWLKLDLDKVPILMLLQIPQIHYHFGRVKIKLTQEHFAEGMENAHGTLIGKATLLANNKTNEATANYYVYLDIIDNNFVYTTSDKKAEVLLKVTNPNNEEVTSLTGLNYVTINEVSGFDIIEASDLINLSGQYTIEAANSKTDEWNIEIIVINLDSDQQENTGKVLNVQLIMDSKPRKGTPRASIADVCSNGDNLAECIKTLEETSY